MQVDRYFRVERRDLVYLKFIVEAYEGLAVLSTVDRGTAIVRISTFPWFLDDIDRLVRSLQSEIQLTETSPPSDDGETGGATDARES
jgi:hypothetical protein